MMPIFVMLLVLLILLPVLLLPTHHPIPDVDAAIDVHLATNSGC